MKSDIKEVTDPNRVISPTGREPITKNKNDELVTPNNAIRTDQGGRAVLNRIKDAHLKRSYAYQRIQGMFDGNPPYNPGRMKQLGINDRTNVNFKDSTAILEAYALTLWSLFNDVRYIAEFQVSYVDDKGMNAYWGQVLSEEFDRVINLWPSWKSNMEFHQLELVTIGLNAIVFLDQDDWRFKPIKYTNLFLPDKTSSNIEEISVVGVERTFTVQELFAVYEKAKDKKDGVWNAEALGHILWELADKGSDERKGWSRFTDIQTAIRNNEVQYEDLYVDQIHLVSIFQKEYDGKITHIMVHRSIESPNQEPPYFSDRQYENMGQCIRFFTLKPGQEFLHGAKGLGQAIFSSMEALVRLDCSAVDQGMRAGSLIIKSGPTRGTDQRQVKFQHGGLIDIGEVNLEQNKFGDNIGGTINLSQYLRQKVFSNNNLSGMDPQSPDRDRAVKHMEAQATKEARIQKNSISHYYDQLDPMLCEMVRKMLQAKKGTRGFEYAEMWKRNCIQRQVPKELFDVMQQDLSPNGLPRFIAVFATRASGSGSQIADQTEVKSCMSIITTLGERGRKAVLQDFITAFRGYRYVDRYFPAEDQQGQPVADDTIASIENNQFQDGHQVTVSPDNNHTVHVTAHIRMLQDVMQQFLQDPNSKDSFELLDKVDKIFAAAGPHLTRHLLFLSQDRTRAQSMQQFRGEWAILSNFGEMIKNNAQAARQGQMNQQAKQASQGQESQGKLQIAAQESQGKLDIKSNQVANDFELGRLREKNRFLLAADELRHRNWLKGAETAHKLSIEAAKAIGLEGSPSGHLPPDNNDGLVGGIARNAIQ